jgi:hypothetical protein
VKAIKKLGEEFFAGVNAEDLDRRMATMDPDVVIMPPAVLPSSAKKRSGVSPTITPRPMKKDAAWFTMRLRRQGIGDLLERLSAPHEHPSRAAELKR